MRFGLLCSAGPKAEGFKAALHARGHPAPLHFTFQQFIQNKIAFEDILKKINILRIDSPGGGYDIWKSFADHLAIPTSGYQSRHGQIYPQGPFVDGTYACIKSACDMARQHDVLCTVDPLAVQCFMDKRATHDLTTPIIPTPEALPEVKGWDPLHNAMKARGIRNVFMKLRYGSAASGVLAIETFGSKLRLWTSVERVQMKGETQLYNSLRIRKYLDHEAKHIIDDVAILGVHTEAWIPKLRLDNKPCDLRLLVVDGQPAHCVVRCSSTPLTNLHLSNARLDVDVVRQQLPKQTWRQVLEIGMKAGQLFPDHLCIGVDIALHKDSYKPYLLEVNAFGDHLNNVTYEGLNPYEFQIRLLEKKVA